MSYLGVHWESNRDSVTRPFCMHIEMLDAISSTIDIFYSIHLVFPFVTWPFGVHIKMMDAISSTMDTFYSIYLVFPFVQQHMSIKCASVLVGCIGFNLSKCCGFENNMQLNSVAESIDRRLPVQKVRR